MKALVSLSLAILLFFSVSLPFLNAAAANEYGIDDSVYEEIYDKGFDEGYDCGSVDGYADAYNDIYDECYSEGYDDGFFEGYDEGYNHAYIEMEDNEQEKIRNKKEKKDKITATVYLIGTIICVLFFIALVKNW